MYINCYNIKYYDILSKNVACAVHLQPPNTVTDNISLLVHTKQKHPQTSSSSGLSNRNLYMYGHWFILISSIPKMEAACTSETSGKLLTSKLCEDRIAEGTSIRNSGLIKLISPINIYVKLAILSEFIYDSKFWPPSTNE
jgi:hypothetical protein